MFVLVCSTKNNEISVQPLLVINGDLFCITVLYTLFLMSAMRRK